jgi:hypothetical protein
MVAKVDLLTSRQTADDSPEKAVRRLWLFGPAHRSFSEGGRPPDAHLPIHGAIGAALSAASPRSFLAVGFPLLSLADAGT